MNLQFKITAICSGSQKMTAAQMFHENPAFVISSILFKSFAIAWVDVKI